MTLFQRGSFLLIVFLFMVSCSASRQSAELQQYTDFKIIESSFILENDTIFLNELRFYKIQSALDAMKLMYQNYGEWSKKSKGKYQENINQIVWNNVKLLDNNESFTVIANGTETLSDYFASVIVLDSNNNDCLDEEHTLKDKLIDLFTTKMNALDKNKSVYRLFR